MLKKPLLLVVSGLLLVALSYLAPSLMRGKWSDEDEQKLQDIHIKHQAEVDRLTKEGGPGKTVDSPALQELADELNEETARKTAKLNPSNFLPNTIMILGILAMIGGAVLAKVYDRRYQ